MARSSQTWPWPLEPPSADHRATYAQATTTPFWLDSPERPAATDPLSGKSEADLAVVGGGLSGLWAAVLAKERDSDRDVVLLEGERVAQAASGRNGGFVIASLTHGFENAVTRYPDEVVALERLGLENFAEVIATIDRYGIDCQLETTGELTVALEPHEVDWLTESAAGQRTHGHDIEIWDRDRIQAEVASPLYLGAAFDRSGSALVNPARLCWGLQRAARELGVRIHEGTWVRSVASRNDGVVLQTDSGSVHSKRAILATSAFKGLVGAVRRRIVPVYDYVLVTEPLSATQRESIGWRGRQGIGESATQFHYYRQTVDHRILWGGYDAIYELGGRVRERHYQRDASFALLAQHFFANFPQLEGTRFTHRWGGAIDTCSRFFSFAGTAHGGRVAYTVGHTGLGVCASRFGAGLALDLADNANSEPARLRSMQDRPTPFPPEPLRWAAIELTRNRLDAADRNAGKRGLWLRILDRLGLGFDS